MCFIFLVILVVCDEVSLNIDKFWKIFFLLLVLVVVYIIWFCYDVLNRSLVNVGKIEGMVCVFIDLLFFVFFGVFFWGFNLFFKF